MNQAGLPAAVLFDFDGTLVDSELVHLRVWNEVLARFGHALSLERYGTSFVGNVSSEASRTLVEELDLPIHPNDLEQEKEERYHQLIRREPLPWMEGARRALDRCHQAGLRVGVVTGSPRSGVVHTLEEFDLAMLIETVVTRDDVLHSKPDPESYRLCLERMQLSADRCVAIEDSANGLRSALAAGLRCLAVPGPFSRDHDFSGATLVADTLQRAVDWVFALTPPGISPGSDTDRRKSP